MRILSAFLLSILISISTMAQEPEVVDYEISEVYKVILVGGSGHQKSSSGTDYIFKITPILINPEGEEVGSYSLESQFLSSNGIINSGYDYQIINGPIDNSFYTEVITDDNGTGSYTFKYIIRIGGSVYDETTFNITASELQSLVLN